VCCSKAHPAVRRELALWAQTALLTGAGFRQEQQRRGPKSLQSLQARCRLWGYSGIWQRSGTHDS
ncbi:hypothetical protein, partial [Acidithiobacillus thiooxidans]|uniref:hypothetical protein n=1 Tax=Acidithiobacillus thiooxidans TaxID=930 RepID=UPI001ED9C10C